jgi:outer membrane protein OmpA-like peptidoglycan-associated protein/opacity protein-like surface antigen
MNKLALATSLALLLPPLQAQEVPSTWAGVQGGYDWQQTGARNAKNNAIFGLAAGTWCTPRWGGELSVLGTQLDSKATGASGKEFHAQVSALFDLAPGQGPWTPYLRAGLGGTRVEAPFSMGSGTTTRFSYHGGAGVQFRPAEHFLLGAEAREIRIETRTAANELVGLVTLGYLWGAPAQAAVAAAPAPEPPPPPAALAAPVAPAAEPAPAAAEAAAMPAPAPEAPEPAAAAPMPAKVVLDEAVLHFANGKSQLPREGVLAVEQVAKSLLAYRGGYTLVVSGYTSSVGSPAYNRALSLRRAEAVAKVLVAAGVPAGAIRTEGNGPDRPVAPNATPQDQARNRRVEIEIKAQGAPVETRETETATTEE